METLGLNNRVLKTLSQSSAKAAVDILGMRLSTTIKDKFVEIMITETEAYGRKNTDKMALFNTYKNIPTSLTLGPPYMSVLRSYGSNRGLFLLTGKIRWYQSHQLNNQVNTRLYFLHFVSMYAYMTSQM